MSSTPAPAKTCLICGLDVSDKPRAKDAQGRYTCKECLDRALKAKAAQQQAKAPPKAPAASSPKAADEPVANNAFLLDLGKPAIKAGQHACPNCAKPVMDDAKICVNCGMNQQTGQRLHIQVQRPDSKPKSK